MRPADLDEAEAPVPDLIGSPARRDGAELAVGGVRAPVGPPAPDEAPAFRPEAADSPTTSTAVGHRSADDVVDDLLAVAGRAADPVVADLLAVAGRAADPVVADLLAPDEAAAAFEHGGARLTTSSFRSGPSAPEAAVCEMPIRRCGAAAVLLEGGPVRVPFRPCCAVALVQGLCGTSRGTAERPE